MPDQRVIWAASNDLEFMIVRTIGPLLLPSSTRRPAMNSQRPKAAKADKRAADLRPLILPMKVGGASLRQIADGLNRCGVPAPRGGDWSAVAVKRILDREVRQTAASA